MTPKEAVEFMRANNILHLKLENGIEITLSPSAPAVDPKDAPQNVAPEKPLNTVGRFGMTRQQQLDLLGQTFESDFKD